jgi:hypothetical protein
MFGAIDSPGETVHIRVYGARLLCTYVAKSARLPTTSQGGLTWLHSYVQLQVLIRSRDQMLKRPTSYTARRDSTYTSLWSTASMHLRGKVRQAPLCVSASWYTTSQGGLTWLHSYVQLQVLIRSRDQMLKRPTSYTGCRRRSAKRTLSLMFGAIDSPGETVHIRVYGARLLCHSYVQLQVLIRSRDQMLKRPTSYTGCRLARRISLARRSAKRTLSLMFGAIDSPGETVHIRVYGARLLKVDLRGCTRMSSFKS